MGCSLDIPFTVCSDSKKNLKFSKNKNTLDAIAVVIVEHECSKKPGFFKLPGFLWLRFLLIDER